MRTIIVDDELWAIDQLRTELVYEKDIEIVGCFQDPQKALEYAQTHTVDFALLDVKMAGMDGITLGYKLRQLYPTVIIVYISCYPEYFSDAYRNVRADYYMLKPYRKEDIRDVVDRVQLLSKRNKKKVQFRTFGRFDMFIDEQPVRFSNQKAKELLAVCVDKKGGIVRMEEAIDKLWEGSPLTENVKARYRKAIAYLHALFLEYRCPDVFTSGYKSCNINVSKVSCDYYDFLESETEAQFFGKYMYEYSWAEETAAELEMKLQKNRFK